VPLFEIGGLLLKSTKHLYLTAAKLPQATAIRLGRPEGCTVEEKRTFMSEKSWLAK
jgi:hypothetical protein